MGYQMAKRLATKPYSPAGSSEEVPESRCDQEDPRGVRLHRGTSMHRGMQEMVMRNVLVWNRTLGISEQHERDFGSVNIKEASSDPPFHREALARASVVFMCLPTSEVTFERIKQLAPILSADCILVDCCSGHPTIARRIAAWLGANFPGIRYLDCPISGGPGGASQGTLATFVGGDADALDLVQPHISAYAANIVHLGPIGAGHATKAINNACNVSNLLCIHEGLLALKKMGVDASLALQVINKSSGRSLMSQARVPEEVLTGDFNYGFKLGLMAKDVGIANDVLDEYFPAGAVYRHTRQVHFDAMAAGTVNFDSDYTEIVKHQEAQAGCRLREVETTCETEAPNPTTAEAQIRSLESENRRLRAELQALQPGT